MINPLYHGIRIVESLEMVDGPFEDWSNVRSPARARRRRHKHPQRIRVWYTPKKHMLKTPDGTIICHPVVAQELRRQLIKQEQERRETFGQMGGLM